MFNIQTWEWYQSSHLTLGKKANKCIFQNVKLFLVRPLCWKFVTSPPADQFWLAQNVLAVVSRNVCIGIGLKADSLMDSQTVSTMWCLWRQWVKGGAYQKTKKTGKKTCIGVSLVVSGVFSRIKHLNIYISHRPSIVKVKLLPRNVPIVTFTLILYSGEKHQK